MLFLPKRTPQTPCATLRTNLCMLIGTACVRLSGYSGGSSIPWRIHRKPHPIGRLCPATPANPYLPLRLPTSGFQLPVSKVQLQTSGFKHRFQASGFRLRPQTSDLNFQPQKSSFRLRPQTSDLNFQPQKSSFKPSGLKLSVSSAQFQTSGLKPSSLRHDTRLSARCSMPCRPESARTGIRPNRRDGPQCRSSDTAAADQ